MLEINLREPIKVNLQFFAAEAAKAYSSDHGLYKLRSFGPKGFWLKRDNRGTYELKHNMETEAADQCYGPQNTSPKSISFHINSDGKLSRISAKKPYGESLDQLGPRHEKYIAMDADELQDIADFLAPGAHADPTLKEQYEALAKAINLPPLQNMEAIKSRIAAEKKITAQDFPQLRQELPTAEKKAELELALSGLNKIIAATTNSAYGAGRMATDQFRAFDQDMGWDAKQASQEGQRIHAYKDKAALQGLAADMALRTSGTNLRDALPEIVSFTSQIPKCLYPYFELDTDSKIGHAFGGSIMAGRIEGSASRARMQFIETIKPASLARTIAEIPAGTIGDDERKALLTVLETTYGYKEGVQKLSTPEHRKSQEDAARYAARAAARGRQ